MFCLPGAWGKLKMTRSNACSESGGRVASSRLHGAEPVEARRRLGAALRCRSSRVSRVVAVTSIPASANAALQDRVAVAEA